MTDNDMRDISTETLIQIYRSFNEDIPALHIDGLHDEASYLAGRMVIIGFELRDRGIDPNRASRVITLVSLDDLHIVDFAPRGR